MYIKILGDKIIEVITHQVVHNFIAGSLISSLFFGFLGTKTPLNPTIDSDLAIVFRLLARLKYGDKKGSISKAVNEAIKDWCKENKSLINEDSLWVENFFGEGIDEILKRELKD